MRSIVGEGRPCNNTQGWLRGALVSISPPRSPLDRRNLLCMVMRIIGLKMLWGMTERSQTRNVWAPQRVERCGSHSDSVKISAPPAQLSLYSPFLLAVPYKAGIVGDMNATIQQNEINNAQRQDQRRLERMSLRAVPPSLPAYEVFVRNNTPFACTALLCRLSEPHLVHYNINKLCPWTHNRNKTSLFFCSLTSLVLGEPFERLSSPKTFFCCN